MTFIEFWFLIFPFLWVIIFIIGSSLCYKRGWLICHIDVLKEIQKTIGEEKQPVEKMLNNIFELKEPSFWACFKFRRKK